MAPTIDTQRQAQFIGRIAKPRLETCTAMFGLVLMHSKAKGCWLQTKLDPVVNLVQFWGTFAVGILESSAHSSHHLLVGKCVCNLVFSIVRSVYNCKTVFAIDCGRHLTKQDLFEGPSLRDSLELLVACHCLIHYR